MKDFFILEGAYIAIAIFILLITLFVTTRPFMPKNAFKKGILYVSTISLSMIFLHFYITKDRINNVKKAFIQGKTILCENRIYTKAAQSIMIQKDNEWSIKNNNFISPNYTRKFHLARCIVK